MERDPQRLRGQRLELLRGCSFRGCLKTFSSERGGVCVCRVGYTRITGDIWVKHYNAGCVNQVGLID